MVKERGSRRLQSAIPTACASVAVLVGSGCALSAQTADDFASVVYAYDSTGASAGFVNPLLALGLPSVTATPTVPDNTGVVSVGNKGFIVLGFRRSIYNSVFNPGGYDFIVFGNAFYVNGEMHKRFQEPGIVEVGVDVNGNGYDASDPFYVLQGSPSPTYGFGGVDDRIVTTWGYADVTPTNGTGDPLIPSNPFASGITAGSAGGDAFDISWARDANNQPIYLPKIDFIRIRSAGTGWSPEIDAASITRSTRAPRIIHGLLVERSNIQAVAMRRKGGPPNARR